MKILFLTSIDHPQVKYEADYLGKKLNLTYIVTPNLERKQLPYVLKCFFKNFPKIFVSLLKLRIPPIPQSFYYVLMLSIILNKEKLHNERYDLIYAHWLYPAGFIGLILSRILNCKIVSAIWGYDIQVLREAKDYGVRGPNRVISRIVIEKSDLVIANHKIHKILAQRISSLKAHKRILYVPPAIPNISTDAQDEFTAELKERLQFILDELEGKKIVLYAPSLRPLYGIREFVRAAQIVSTYLKDCVFIVVGDGELKDEVIKFIKENGLEDKVVLVGKVSHESMKVLYKSSTLVCDLAYPGTGTTTLEALCFGKPVIGIKSPKTIITNGVNGFVIKKDNHKSLANYIITILEDHKLRERLSINARKTFEEKFIIQKRINKLLEIFNYVIK
ncbi:MAG: glycosyltransferase family 4 protein [Candidatus Verstraetearchaeota archaeon]|nr:glycosyltransferase family 4 protein [Candidatus Verstraetearchaeota archaeon]